MYIASEGTEQSNRYRCLPLEFRAGQMKKKKQGFGSSSKYLSFYFSKCLNRIRALENQTGSGS